MATQPTTVTRKGQVTIPKRIREAMALRPCSLVVFDVNEQSDIVLRCEDGSKPRTPVDFSKLLGAATIKWHGTTDEYMALIRGYADDPR